VIPGATPAASGQRSIPSPPVAGLRRGPALLVDLDDDLVDEEEDEDDEEDGQQDEEDGRQDDEDDEEEDQDESDGDEPETWQVIPLTSPHETA
jgi:hypothetical protein